MSDAPRPDVGLGPVFLTVLLDLLGFGLVIPLISYYSEAFGASENQAIALLGMYSLAQFFFAPVWGVASDRFGRRPVMLLSVGATALMLAAFASAEPLAKGLLALVDPGASPERSAAVVLGIMFVTRFLHGSFTANISTAQAVVADVTAPEDRARGMGLLGAAFGIGFTLGPWMGGELARYGHAVPIWIAASLSAVNFVWVWLRLPETRRADSTRSKRSVNPVRLLDGLRHPVVGSVIALTFVATLAFAMMEVSFPLVAEHVWQMREADVGRLLGLVGVIGIVVQGGLIRFLVRQFGEVQLVLAGFAFAVAGLGCLSMVTGGAVLYGTVALLGIGSSLYSPSLNALISRGAGEDEQGYILGVNQSLSALARAIAPWMALALYAGWFRGGAFAGGAILMSVALLLAFPATRSWSRAQASGSSESDGASTGRPTSQV